MKTHSGKNINQDKQLIELCKKNDRRAQLKVYDNYCLAMYTTCKNMVKDSLTAEELMQEAFLSAFKNIKRFKAEVTFGAWLKKIVINKCLDHLKTNKVQFVELNENLSLNEVENNSNVTFKGVNSEQIKNAIEQLPSGYKTVTKLYLLEGYDHNEIAEILKINASTSRSQFYRAKTLLVKSFNT